MGRPGNMQGPRFVDAHVHIREAGELATVSAAGVIAVRDAGLRDNITHPVAVKPSPGNLPIIVSARWALCKKGGYGSLFGVAVETREEIKAQILKLKIAGAGIIKVMASGMVSLKEPGTVTVGGFSGDDLSFMVAQARSHGLEVMAHANGETAIIDAVAAGVRSIEHGFFMTTRALEEMAGTGTFWTPTVGALARALQASGASQEAKTFVEALLRSQLTMIGQAHEIGVPLAVGTDCVLPEPGYQKAYEAELQYFERAGLSRDEVLKVACVDGARLLGI